MARILETDGMAAEGIALLTEQGHEVDSKKLTPAELIAAIPEYDALVIRSATTVTADVLAAGAPRLKLVGRAGVGVDNVDLTAATAQGIIVMNAPLGNILSAAEHAIGMIFAAARTIAPAHEKMMAGIWDKKNFVGVELCGRTLGVIGLGKIGKHVAKVMRGAGMKIIAHDPFLTAEVAKELDIEPVDLDDLLARADVISLHTPLTDKTRNMIDAAALKKMKPTARLVNVARGGIVNEGDLAAALKDGVIGGAALDVFGKEPLQDGSPLRGCPRLTLTPHLGASTAEAQVRVSTDIADAFNLYFTDGTIQNAVNVKLEVDKAIEGYLPAAEVLGAALAQTLTTPLRALEVEAFGDLAAYDIKALGVATLKGALSRISENEVNLINAGVIAEERGITITTANTAQQDSKHAALMVTATTSTGTSRIGGSLFDHQLRIQIFDDYILDLPIGNHLLMVEYQDRPGMVGKIGSILGDNEINIARMEVSRVDGRGDALMMLVLDDPVPAPVVAAISDGIQARRSASITI